jgi:hypothetical protein
MRLTLNNEALSMKKTIASMLETLMNLKKQTTSNKSDDKIEELEKEIEELKQKLLQYEMGWPPGHFYSPIPSLDQIKKIEYKIWGVPSKQVSGVDLQENKQVEMLHQFSSYYNQQPWQDGKQEHLRYYFHNPNYSYGESIVLFCLLMQIKPKKIIEIGSGYSSCALLDTNELFFNNSIALTFIEPYPDLLSSLLKPSDINNINIVSSGLQDIDENIFATLSAGDILFIDSTHVSKIGSDVNYIFFKILPLINSGVYIHFHDIYFPFEYPKKWIYEGRAWNEAYLLRAFLQNNREFEIVFFNSFISDFYMDMLQNKMPLCAKNPGSSIWIKKI